MNISVSLFAWCMFSVLLGMYLGADCLAHLPAEQHFSVGGTDRSVFKISHLLWSSTSGKYKVMGLDDVALSNCCENP